jgi:uncharacterized protein with FMN-binding domain
VPTRGIVALVITVLSLVLLLSFKTPEASPIAGGLSRPTERPPLATTVPGTSGVTPAPSGPAQSAAGTANGQVTSPVVDTRYGPVQLAATFSKGKLTDVKALQLPFDRQLSARISSYIEPILRQEALTAQSAKIDHISGATYTSEAYAQSLQAVINRAHG